MLEDALLELLERLAEQGARFALVGGLAVSVWTEPRFTRDADVCVAVDDDAEVEALVRHLRSSGYDVVAIVEQEATRRIASVRLTAETRPEGAVILDLLFASSGVEPEIVATAQDLEIFAGITAPVASVAALIAMKVLARDDASRPQDRVDLVALWRIATASDVAAAHALVRLIEERGYHRGKDLVAELEGLRAELGDRPGEPYRCGPCL